jgi:signal transduction histidine kinase
MIRKSATAVIPVVAAILLAAGSDLPSEPGPQLGCRILPNAMVPVVAGRSAGCELRPYDRVIAARGAAHRPIASRSDLQREVEAAAAAGHSSLPLLVVRRGDERWIGVPIVGDTRAQIVGRFLGAVLVSALVMAVSLIILWGSSEAAAGPFAYFYACASVVLVSVLGGRYSDALVIPAVVASGLVPATLSHIALTFPREREVVRQAPQVVRVIYGFSALLTLIAVVNLTRSPTVWALADRMILVLSLLTWSLLVIGCVLSVRESRSALERVRAKLLLAGTAAVPSVPLLIGLWFGSDLPGGSLALMTFTVAVLPLPVGYAISHYRLFDLGLDLRRAIAYLLYLLASATIVSGLVIAVALGFRMSLPFGDPVVLFGVALGSFLVGDPLRDRLRGAIDSWMAPGMARTAAVADEHARRVAVLLDPDECLRLLCQTVLEGVDPKGASAYLAEDGDWRLSCAAGTGTPVRSHVAALAAKAVGDDAILCLADVEASSDPSREELRSLGIDVVAPLRSGERSLGLLLLMGPRRGASYTTPQLRFVEAVARQSAAAIQNADLARNLASSERLAAQGRLGAGLIHDLGKPLGVIERLAERLPQRSRDPARLARDAATITDLASQTRTTLRDFLDSTQRAVAEGPGKVLDVETLIDRAVRTVERSHGRGRISVRLQTDLPAPREGSGKLVRALANLLDNALLACDPGDVVEVVAGAQGGDLEISVIDRGCGMSEALLARAFEPFFTTRERSRGNGLGLAVCRDLMEGMGGRVELVSEPGRGTCARLHVPGAPGGSRDA